MQAPPAAMWTEGWSLWALLLSCAAAGQLADARTKLGSLLGGPLVSMLCAVLLASCGIIPMDTPAYDVVWTYLMPLAAACFLLDTDVSRLLQTGGPVLLAFLIGAIGMVLGALAGWSLLKHQLGPQAGCIAACLCSSYVGGSINFVAVSQAVGLDFSHVPTCMAADNLAMAGYLAVLMAVPVSTPEAVVASASNGATSCGSSGTITSASSNDTNSASASTSASSGIASSSVSADTATAGTSQPTADSALRQQEHSGAGSSGQQDAVTAGSISLSLACAAGACALSQAAAAALNLRPLTLTIMAVIAMALSAGLRRLLGGSGTPSGEAAAPVMGRTGGSDVWGPSPPPPSAPSPFAGSSQLGGALMLLFFAVVGAGAGGLAQSTGTSGRALVSMLAFMTVMVAVHWAVMALAWRLLRLPVPALLLGSNCNIGGPATAASMALSKGWAPMAQTAMLVGSLGYAIGTTAGLLVARLTGSLS